MDVLRLIAYPRSLADVLQSILNQWVTIASLATLAAATPLPLNPDGNKALVARADIVSVKCPTVNNAAEATYSVKEIEDAYNIAVGLLQPPPHYATGKPSMCLDTS